MSARFALDLLHPGHVADSWQDWFVGPQGARRLLIVAGICAGVILLVVITLVLPPTFRLSRDQGAIPKLRADLATRDGNLSLLRQDLQALGVEAKRQVRWADILNAFRRQTTETCHAARERLHDRLDAGNAGEELVVIQAFGEEPVGHPQEIGVGGNEVTNPFVVTEVFVPQGGKWTLASLSFTRLLTP